MLRFNKITIQNFGPYYGTQEIILMPKDGVSFVWGLNGFGKTSFLNAVRYALWGSLANSKHANRPIVKFINRKAIAEGKNMMVRLDCDYNGKRCVIIRLLERNQLTDGTKNEDYAYSLSVLLDAQTLSQDEAEKFLSTALPTNISRFYLFDAELLDQYESLIEENNDNTELKLEIENILGLPILYGARKCLSGNGSISSVLEKEYERVSKEDDKNTKNLKSYESNKKRKEQLESEISELTMDLKKLYAAQQDLEDTLQENKQFRYLVEKESEIKAKIEALTDALEEERQKVSKAMETLWTAFFDVTIQQVINEKNQELNDLQAKADDSQEESLLLGLIGLLEHRNASECPICSNTLTSKHLDSLKAKIKTTSSSLNTRLEISKLKDQILSLSNMKEKKSISDIISLVEGYSKIFDNINALNFEIEDIKSKKKSFHTTVTDAEIIKIVKEHSDVSRQIAEGETGLSKAQEELEKTKLNIEKLRNLISNNGGKAVKRVESQRHFVEQLESILSDSVAWFRDDLKSRVESSASEIFRNISHNKDYIGLQINDNYGLEIVKADGEFAPNRSEGYEQVVAISLIAALHKNAPIAGPIIMDSTFQRIDGLHKKATLMELPNMAKQIIVLAYPEEVNKSDATNLLGAHYLQDFHLEQIDSLETQIHDNSYE